MKENEKVSVEEILKPIKQRPSLAPRKEFVQSVRKQLETPPIQKVRRFAWKPVMVASLVALCFFVLVSTLDFHIMNPSNDAGNEHVTFPVLEQEQIKQLFTIEYGEDIDQIGIERHGAYNHITATAESFDVENNEFYILDNVKKQVYITDGHGRSRVIEIENAWNLVDILVTEDLDIYILDDGTKAVYRYSNDGKLIETFEISLQLPTGLAFIPNIGVTVNQAEGLVESIETGERVPVAAQPYKAVRVNDSKGKIQINEGESLHEIPIQFEHFLGGFSVLAVTEDQIVLSKYESLNNAPEGEQHVYIIDKPGEMLGGVRIPLENTSYINRHFIRIDGNKLYFLSAEEQHVAIYEIHPGKNYEKLLTAKEDFEVPDKITLQYHPVELMTLLAEVPTSGWEKVGEIPMGDLQGSPIIIELYTYQEEYEVNGFVLYKEQRYNIGTLTYGNNEDLKNYLLTIPFESDESHIELIGAIGAQGDIGYQYLLYDHDKRSFLSYFNWGFPIVQDVDGNGPPEILMQFEGKGLNFGTVEILKWNNGAFEVTRVIESLPSRAPGTKPIQIVAENEMLHVTIDEESIQYKFVNADKLVRISSTGKDE